MEKTSKRRATPDKTCPYCGKIVAARGYKAHIRLTHGFAAQKTIISKGKSIGSINGVKPAKKVKHKRNTDFDVSFGELLLAFGVGWVIKKAIDWQEQQTLQSERSKLNKTNVRSTPI